MIVKGKLSAPPMNSPQPQIKPKSVEILGTKIKRKCLTVLNQYFDLIADEIGDLFKLI